MQRHIRTSLLTQYPYLSQPAWRDPSTVLTSGQAPNGEEDDEPAEAVKDDGGKGKKKGKGKGGKGKAKDDKEEKDAATEEGEGGGKDDSSVTVLDEIWPKKEALGLTKWLVCFIVCFIRAKARSQICHLVREPRS